MPDCPNCLGEGGHDLRDMNALIQEHVPPGVDTYWTCTKEDWVECDECEGTGVVSEARLVELKGFYAHAFDQMKAKMQHEGRWPL